MVSFLENQTYAYKRTIQLFLVFKIVDMYFRIWVSISLNVYPIILLFLKAGYLRNELPYEIRFLISNIFEIT